MKSQSQNPLLALKPFTAQHLQFISLLSYSIIFGFGLTSGIIISFNLKDFSSFYLPHLTGRFSYSSSNSTKSSALLPIKTNSPSPPIHSHRVGLEEYLKVQQSAMHDLNEEELLWRASMAPKVREFPYPRVPKVAFLFLTKWSIPLAPLWEKFFHGQQGLFSIYVHSHPLFDEKIPSDSVFYGRNIPSKEVNWGNVNMIEAERRLLANALLDFSNQRFVLLSESCIPLFNFSTIYDYLINSTSTFVEIYDFPGPVGRGRYSRRLFPSITLHQWRKGSQWFEMDRDLAVEVVSDRTYFPLFQRLCKLCYADEHYLPTLVNVKFGEKNSNRSLTWTDWSKRGSHPARFMRHDVTVEFLKRLRSSEGCEYNGKETRACFLFARKFSLHALGRLLRFAPQVMHF